MYMKIGLKDLNHDMDSKELKLADLKLRINETRDLLNALCYTLGEMNM